jgi:hypothetical protein
VVVVDATASSGIDSTSAESFRAARDELAAAGIDLWVVNARAEGWRVVVATLDAAGATLPPMFESLADAVTHFESAEAPPATADLSVGGVSDPPPRGPA